MKTSQDPRHVNRQHIVQELFSKGFHDQPVNSETEKVLLNKDLIDKAIQEAAPEYPIEKINRVDLAILRLASYELLIDKKNPKNVVIDEAVELAKEFGNDTSPAFVNGVLGHIISYGQTS